MKPVRNSCKAVIVQDRKVLLTKNRDDFGFFHLFPGGGQEPGETLTEALARECMEEVGAEIQVVDLIHIREYIGKNHEFAQWDADVHQVEFYFRCHLRDPHATITDGTNPDANQVAVEWIDIDELHRIRLYPKTLGKIIAEEIRMNVYLGDIN
ncbi:NUDIX domain-containing protein [Cohnella caldifontis]|uniref:NUDIX domain-containing protein n=1 Tax=Cohnella caldifontis TaxID=3027471 RepID=UPI0023EC7D95|nr:NUDIX domain-containing protein [Cohnella sp. YIM B05605]